jgi:hypothetical protein
MEAAKMEWSTYIAMAAQHSKNNAAHWFRYLRKDIDKCDVLFTRQQIEELYNDESLTPFQRVSLKAAFENGSQTRQHILSLNNKANLDRITAVREKYEHVDSFK